MMKEKSKPKKTKELIRALCDKGTTEKGTEETPKHRQDTILQETQILKTYFLIHIFYPIMAPNSLSHSLQAGVSGPFFGLQFHG